MTLRDAIDTAIEGRELGLDPKEVLADHGFGDLPNEMISSAFEHFAGSASMEMADKLAPIVTRLSDVPFEESDLAPLEGAAGILAEGGSALDLLSELELSNDGLDDSDPVDFDFLDEVVDLEGVDDEPFDTDIGDEFVDDFDDQPDPGADGDSPFGEGHESLVSDAIEQIETVEDDDGEAPVDDLLEEVHDAVALEIDHLDGSDDFDINESHDPRDHAAEAFDGDDDSDPADFDF